MYRDKKIAVVIPAYNEEKMIGRVLETMPAFVDTVIVVNDASNDGTEAAVQTAAAAQPERRIVSLKHERKMGNGAARVTGLHRALETDAEIVGMMDGDGQMNPDDLPALLDPIAAGEVDYTKGNRLFSGKAWEIIPRKRYYGNAALTLLTKIASGYWHIADFQSGYAAISRKALQAIKLDHLYHDYGFPNDMLIHLNVYNFRVKDIPIEPVYNIGEKSAMRLAAVIPRISRLLWRRFLWRVKQKYIIRDFHPLVFFYGLAFLLLGVSGPLLIRLIFLWIINGKIPPLNALALVFCVTMGFQCLFFAMFFDMDSNKHLK